MEMSSTITENNTVSQHLYGFNHLTHSSMSYHEFHRCLKILKVHQCMGTMINYYWLLNRRYYNNNLFLKRKF